LNIDIDIDSVDDTFGVSISASTILLGRGIESIIDDTFKAVFCRYFDIDTFEFMLINFQRISSVKVNYLKQNLASRTTAPAVNVADFSKNLQPYDCKTRMSMIMIMLSG